MNICDVQQAIKEFSNKSHFSKKSLFDIMMPHFYEQMVLFITELTTDELANFIRVYFTTINDIRRYSCAPILLNLITNIFEKLNVDRMDNEEPEKEVDYKSKLEDELANLQMICFMNKFGPGENNLEN